ncbi:hypothetical protein QQS21_011547, partial [Conoideocrella luteorostrata]
QLTARIEEERAKAAAAAVEAKEQKLVVEKLIAKELGLRTSLDNLEAFIERLQTKISDAAAEEKELQSRIVHLTITDSCSRHVDGSITYGEREGQDKRARVEDDELDATDNPPPLEEEPCDLATAEDETQQAGPKSRSILSRSEQVCIKFKLFENGTWIVKHEVVVDRKEPLEVMRVSAKYLSKEIGLLNMNIKALTRETRFWSGHIGRHVYRSSGAGIESG